MIRIIGVPMDLGQNRRGVDMGPSAIRYAGLQARLQRLGYTVTDRGNIEVKQAEEMQNPVHHDEAGGLAHHLPQVAEVCRDIYTETREHWQDDEHLIFLGGDHSMSIGTVAAVSKDRSIGVIWVDAHGDYNTPHTTPSGNIHGMSVATLLGDGPDLLTQVGYEGAKVQASQVAMIGVRDLDKQERDRLVHSGIAVHTMRQVDEHGINTVARMVLDRFIHLDHIHVSLDLDCLDPSVAPGVGTPVPGGLSYREAHLLMEILADSGKVGSLDVVEINPILDHQNSTAQVAVELVASLFGQSIL